MQHRSNARPTVLASLILAGSTFLLPAAQAADEDAARALARQSNCFRCHAVDKHKEAPPWREVAKKYRGKAGAEEKLIHHITSGEKVKFEDGHEEDHKIVASQDPAEIKNLVDWILSL